MKILNLSEAAEFHRGMLPMWQNVYGGPESDGSIELEALLERSIKACAVSGVYFLFKRKKLLYVGQSRNVFSRVGTHARRVKFDAFAYIEYPVHLLKRYETIYIHRFQPPLNKQGVNLD